MIILENNVLIATFNPKGAELQSLNGKATGLSYMWNGDPAFWAKHSPVLFPVVGALKNGTYTYKGESFRLSRHGFARDLVFNANQISKEEVLFTLNSNQDTMAVYPFEFKLGIRYKIEAGYLSCTYEISNPGKEDLLFSIGAHPAFNVPLQDDVAYTDCYLEFEKDAELTYHKIKNDLIDDETETIVLEDSRLPLTHELFYDDALVFKKLKSNVISVKNYKNNHGIHFYFEEFPFFGIWAAKDANFVCLEPWCGIADGVHHNQELENKEGIISLSPNEEWERTWEVEIF
ncbi:aldose 1-epimerase family protein [Pedobacter sp. MC2016-14]|uniref:aldose 1-epimerase family protein n=1 Tax=Pedobacter sp. MC2016-14 TaxID=2897327 RepID=UPI001E60FB3B|nr:aldose 1-epimerase family protein [Pedobacter sp. MC2016-14]MCD0488223.1 aldose 1-epimerase family protein [Pedobacter sp. MC2016-14]